MGPEEHCRRFAVGPWVTMLLGLAVLGLAAPGVARAQSSASAATGQPAAVADAAEADGDTPKRRLVSFNEYEGRRFSIRVGFGLLYDYSGYAQDDDSKAQMTLRPVNDLRDFRVLLKGRLPIPRVTYTLGYMYDKANEKWRFRQTGIMVDVRKAYGNLFVGRTKEGFSTSKIMVGYQGFTNERAATNDALVPILADGVKWNGTIPNGKLVYNIGFFEDTRSETESFNKNDEQVVGRVVWLPLAGTDRVLHFALQARHARADDGFLQYRSKPESFQAQSYAIDTGRFAAESADTYGFEIYYRPGPLLVGGEYFVNTNEALDAGDPTFHGGELLAAWLITGETRPYNGRGAYFERVSPARPVFEGGLGAWELVTRFSYADFDDGVVRGGRFWRFTPMVNWHMSDNIRLEFVYGYGSLNRSGLTGKTQFFQTRFQFQL